MRGPIGHADEHEPASAQIPCLGMHHREGEASSHRRIDCVSSCPHHLYTGARSQFVHARDYAMLRVHRMHWRSQKGGRLR